MGVPSPLRLALGLVLSCNCYARPSTCPLQEAPQAEVVANSLLQRDGKLQSLHSPPIAEQKDSHVLIDHDGLEWLIDEEPQKQHQHAAADAGNAGNLQHGTSAGSFSVMSVVSSHSSKPTRHRSLEHHRPITFVTIRDPFFDTNLGLSPLWQYRHELPHQWIILDNPENEGVSALYARAQAEAQHPLRIFLHPDVKLPGGWYEKFIAKLQIIETFDPGWAVLGTAGIPASWAGTGQPFIASSIVDFGGSNSYTTGADRLEVQSLDEHLLVLRDGSPSFDADLPGFDLYGTDIVLSARKAGLKAYLLNMLVFHKKSDVDGQPFQVKNWLAKISDNSYRQRALATQRYLSDKWCSSGFLPVYGCAFSVWCPMSN